MVARWVHEAGLAARRALLAFVRLGVGASVTACEPFTSTSGLERPVCVVGGQEHRRPPDPSGV
jgi:hypothetical protein